jgi:site-specific DNA-methyltransferase (adenine-specific)
MSATPKITIMPGDARERLKEFPGNHFGSCVCDPPYEMGFMGAVWDRSGVAWEVGLWGEVLRVLKPGAHLEIMAEVKIYGG